MTRTFVSTRNRTFNLGEDVSSAQSLDEALSKARMNFGLKIIKGDELAARETRQDGSKTGWVSTRIPGRNLVFRDDNWDILGVVGNDYQPVPFAPAFQVADLIRQNIPGTTFDRAFSDDFGRIGHLSLRMPDFDLQVGDDEVFKLGMHFSTGHDGGASISGRVVLERQICTNGMTVEIKGVGHKYKIRHTVSAEARLAEAHKIMADSTQYVEAFVQTARLLIGTPMSDVEYGAFIDDLFPQPYSGSMMTANDKQRREMNAWAQHRAQLVALFQRASTNESGRGTRWAAFNAVTEDADWGGTVRRGNSETLEEARARRQLQGVNQIVKDRALTRLAVDLAA